MSEAPKRIWVESGDYETDAYEHPEYGGDEYIRRDAITPEMAAEVLLKSVRAKDLAIEAMRPGTLVGRDICHYRWRSALLAITKDKTQ